MEPAGSQDGTEAAAGSSPTFHPSQGNCDRYHAYQGGSGLSQLSRDGHPRATHVNVRILASPSKNGTVPSGSSGMIGKLGAPCHEHKHLCPLFPDTVQVTQAPTRQPQPSAKSFVEWKRNTSQIAERKFIWRFALTMNGLKMKIWQERVGTPHKAVRSEPHARGKDKVNL
ncbi:uncharacterized protein LOC111861886 [Cryptotermes secundus]|uniref:uncharacterized protein LOC111861886 n=1 Tax=Cryptotermes secundus TaxID=105785 RepID=UPI000CD7BE06|nr:uncharacterized protein LOC111861886 [Cryptotermes secundus]